MLLLNERTKVAGAMVCMFYCCVVVSNERPEKTFFTIALLAPPKSRMNDAVVASKAKAIPPLKNRQQPTHQYVYTNTFGMKGGEREQQGMRTVRKRQRVKGMRGKKRGKREKKREEVSENGKSASRGDADGILIIPLSLSFALVGPYVWSFLFSLSFSCSKRFIPVFFFTLLSILLSFLSPTLRDVRSLTTLTTFCCCNTRENMNVPSMNV